MIGYSATTLSRLNSNNNYIFAGAYRLFGGEAKLSSPAKFLIT